MPFQKGKSGNPLGRPKQTAEQKSQKEQFKKLLKASTVDALQSIIQIANDTKLTECCGVIGRVKESRNPKKVIRVALMENYGEIGKVLVNLSWIRYNKLRKLKKG